METRAYERRQHDIDDVHARMLSVSVLCSLTGSRQSTWPPAPRPGAVISYIFGKTSNTKTCKNRQKLDKKKIDIGIGIVFKKAIIY